MDEFSGQEALNQAQLLAEIFEIQLAQHPLIKADADFTIRCEAIADQFGALYQAVGAAGAGVTR
jgi:hypothetical protein